MKILFVSYHYWPPNFGGELLLSIERFESLIDRGHEIIVLTSGSKGYSKFEVKNGLKIYRSPFIHHSKLGRISRRIFFIFWLIPNIVKLKFDILHLSGTGGFGPFTSNISNWLVCKISKIKGAKNVYVHSLADSESEMFSEKFFKHKLRRLFLNQIDKIVSVGPALHQAVSKYYPQKSFLIINKVRDDIFIPATIEERIKFRSDNGISEKDIVLSFLGSVTKRKGFDILAKVFLELSASDPNYMLWIIGPKSNKDNQNIAGEDEILEYVNRLEKMSEHVKFWGRINDRKEISKILGCSDIFIFPTRQEGMPLSPMEAMATRIPVIISNLIGVTDVAIKHNRTGLLIPPNDVNALSKAILSLKNDPELRKRISENGYSEIKSDFCWDKFIDEWESLYFNLAFDK